MLDNFSFLPSRVRCHITRLFHGGILFPPPISPVCASQCSGVAYPTKTASPCLCVSRRGYVCLRQRCESVAGMAQIKALSCAFCWGYKWYKSV